MNKYLSKVEEEILQYYKDVNVSDFRRQIIIDDGVSENKSSINKKSKINDTEINGISSNKRNKVHKVKDSVKKIETVRPMKHDNIVDEEEVRFFIHQIK